MREDEPARWSFLEEESDGCCVVTRRMELVYLNAVARSLVPGDFLGRRCWEVFPVGDQACASRCPAVRAVSKAEADAIVYCEETLHVAGGPVTLGVAVIPLQMAQEGRERGLLLLRPKTAGSSDEAFRQELLEHARRLLALALTRLAR